MGVDKPIFGRGTAEAVALKMVEALTPVCVRIDVAGSIRRRRPHVHDVDLVLISKIEMRRPEDGLMEVQTDLVLDPQLGALAEMIAAGKIEIARGRQEADAKIVRVVGKQSRVPVDLYFADERSFAGVLLCRTGSAAHNKLFAAEAQARGWKWGGGNGGFRKNNSLKEAWPADERGYYAHLGLPYLDPVDRERVDFENMRRYA